MTARVAGVLLDEADTRLVVGVLDTLAVLTRQRGQRLRPDVVALRKRLTDAAAAPDVSASEPVPDSLFHSVYDTERSYEDTRSAARMLGITPHGVRHLLRTGRLEGHRHAGTWYVDRDSLIERTRQCRLPS
ncbi:DNA-binding protein [Rhodococcus sp. ABRD24]|uniref:helix-turn-helix domain-containing protein n=1 Tax=Rhodococcus sp. ABRD24 TaxID=2507582 RepID=UPI00103B2D57|nr:helix-turn-helix domain-containing protein [Rhodococcus sp. ABRD24]QBJ94752.1 DNA-binding protein [Rhodococcus sp. ABRD24]